MKNKINLERGFSTPEFEERLIKAQDVMQQYKFDGTIKINGQLAVQAKISSNLVDRVEV